MAVLVTRRVTRASGIDLERYTRTGTKHQTPGEGNPVLKVS
jgi:hypothetical protein